MDLVRAADGGAHHDWVTQIGAHERGCRVSVLARGEESFDRSVASVERFGPQVEVRTGRPVDVGQPARLLDEGDELSEASADVSGHRRVATHVDIDERAA